MLGLFNNVITCWLILSNEEYLGVFSLDSFDGVKCIVLTVSQALITIAFWRFGVLNEKIAGPSSFSSNKLSEESKLIMYYVFLRLQGKDLITFE